MTPILNGAPGFILLTLSVGIGAYVRQVYVGASETYDKIIRKKLEAIWPLDKQYTLDRLENIDNALLALRIVTIIMFAFILATSLRLIAYAMTAADMALLSDETLCKWDVVMTVWIGAAFGIMWIAHAVTSAKEREYHRLMRAEAKKKFPKLSTT